MALTSHPSLLPIFTLATAGRISFLSSLVKDHALIQAYFINSQCVRYDDISEMIRKWGFLIISIISDCIADSLYDIIKYYTFL